MVTPTKTKSTKKPVKSTKKTGVSDAITELKKTPELYLAKCLLEVFGQAYVVFCTVYVTLYMVFLALSSVYSLVKPHEPAKLPESAIKLQEILKK
jgi:hypothetical protein